MQHGGRWDGTKAGIGFTCVDIYSEENEISMFPVASITSTETSSSSSLPRPKYEYDVFLNFRGEDTRNNFTDHLYAALDRKGIKTFRDDEELERGKPIRPELLTAIEESRFAVIILSRNYAWSTWCLDELAKIVECMKQTRLTVLPVFYDVDPSDVRKPRTGSFEEAFAEHEERFKENRERVQRWIDALREVADVSGWHLQDRPESTVIEEIVGKMLGQLDSIPPFVSDDLVGIDSRVEELMNLYLGIGVDDVRFVGICGMSGIGKTTLARAVYERIACQFEANCFLANVREEAGKHGLVALQKQLLSSTIQTKSSINIWDVYKGANVIRNRLCSKRVLIILDDVDQCEQLCALAEKRCWFGRGSRIIITTRDKRVLIEHNVAEDDIYEAKKLNYDEALQVFSRKAFKEDHPAKDFVELSKKFLNYAKGLPLALEVLGSSLYLRSVDVWESMLSKLKEIPDEKIHDKLQISFDGLPEVEKKIFLDIACFFKWEDKNRVEDVLESCGYHPKIGIDNLINKSLITIFGKKLWLHDLLEEMGREIVRRESFEEPGRRSRLWFWEDIFHVLKNNTGTERVEGIALDSADAPKEGIQLNAEAFSKLPNLRFLKIHNTVHLCQGLTYLPNKLRAIDWPGYPLKSLPMSFSPDKLVELNMPCSYIKEIWKGKKSLPKLKILDLIDSPNLIKTPDFTEAPNLEKLILSGCFKLEKFPEIVENMKCLKKLKLDCLEIKELPLSIGRLCGLTILDLGNCHRLLTLPSVICNLTSLQNLTLCGCSKLDEMPEDLGNLKRLKVLDVGRTAIRQVPSSIQKLKNLKDLCFGGCKGLLVYPTSFLGLCHLTTLDLSYCDLPDGAIPNDLSSMSSLQILDLRGNNIEHIPESISQLSKLKILLLRDCSRLRSLPILPPNVLYVQADDTTSLKTLCREMFGWYTEGQHLSEFIRHLSRLKTEMRESRYGETYALISAVIRHLSRLKSEMRVTLLSRIERRIPILLSVVIRYLSRLKFAMQEARSGEIDAPISERYLEAIIRHLSRLKCSMRVTRPWEIDAMISAVICHLSILKSKMPETHSTETALISEAIHDLSTVNYEASAAIVLCSFACYFIRMLFQFAYHILIYLSLGISIFTNFILIFLTLLISFNPFKCKRLWHCSVEEVYQSRSLESHLRRLIIFLGVFRIVMFVYVKFLRNSR